MKSNIKSGFFTAVVVSGLAALLAGCPAGGQNLPTGGPSGMRGGGAGSVDPDTCGNYAANDTGRKLKAFLEATVQLDQAVKNTENYLRDSCAMMGSELGVSGEGDTRTVCTNVANALSEHMQVGLKGGAKLKIDYQPAVCTVNVDAAASAAAKCEGKAQADVSVRCEGGCRGTCEGTCDGKCVGAAGTGGAAGQCNGECQGTCRGSCSGGCEGHADVQASASCEAKAEVTANVEAKCTEPEMNVTFDAKMVVDKSKIDAAVRAIKKGMPRILMVQAKISGPVKAAFVTWSKASADLAKSSRTLVSSLGDQAMCVSGQIAAAAGMLGGIQSSIDVQVEVSVEVSASASGSAGGGARGGAAAPLIE
jgi:hypothetical protein